MAAGVRNAFHLLQQMSQLRPSLVQNGLATVANALVTARLDYYNAFYWYRMMWQ